MPSQIFLMTFYKEFYYNKKDTKKCTTIEDKNKNKNKLYLFRIT